MADEVRRYLLQKKGSGWRLDRRRFRVHLEVEEAERGHRCLVRGCKALLRWVQGRDQKRIWESVYAVVVVVVLVPGVLVKVEAGVCLEEVGSCEMDLPRWRAACEAEVEGRACEAESVDNHVEVRLDEMLVLL